MHCNRTPALTDNGRLCNLQEKVSLEKEEEIKIYDPAYLVHS